MSTPALSALARPARAYERPGLNADEVEEIREAFKLFDADGSGTIDPRELKEAMLSLGLGSRTSTVASMVAQFDVAGAGRIDFEQFLDLMTAKPVSARGGWAGREGGGPSCQRSCQPEASERCSCDTGCCRRRRRATQQMIVRGARMQRY